MYLEKISLLRIDKRRETELYASSLSIPSFSISKSKYNLMF